MTILYFPTIDGDRLNPSGDFTFGQGLGEGTGDRSYGIRIRTAGSGSHRTLRPRLLLPVQDDLQVQLQARILSTIVSANDFEGVGLQVRAFRYDGINVNEVWRNQSETNPRHGTRKGPTDGYTTRRLRQYPPIPARCFLHPRLWRMAVQGLLMSARYGFARFTICCSRTSTAAQMYGLTTSPSLAPAIMIC